VLGVVIVLVVFIVVIWFIIGGYEGLGILLVVVDFVLGCLCCVCSLVFVVRYVVWVVYLVKLKSFCLFEWVVFRVVLRLLVRFVRLFVFILLGFVVNVSFVDLVMSLVVFFDGDVDCAVFLVVVMSPVMLFGLILLRVMVLIWLLLWSVIYLM